MNHLWRDLLHVLGVLPRTPSSAYNWWSGAGSDLPEVAILGTVVAVYRHHRCSACWRIAHHPVAGTTFKTCHRHLTALDHADLAARHATDRPEQHAMLNPAVLP